MKFVIDGTSKMSAKVEPALVRLVARAHPWFEDLVSGRASSMVEIGKREKIGKRHVSEIIRLAFLAPDIVEQIVNGVQPPYEKSKQRESRKIALPAPADVSPRDFRKRRTRAVLGKIVQIFSASRTRCGGGGIRTHEGLASLPVFKTGAFNRSATPPSPIF